MQYYTKVDNTFPHWSSLPVLVKKMQKIFKLSKLREWSILNTYTKFKVNRMNVVPEKAIRAKADRKHVRDCEQQKIKNLRQNFNAKKNYFSLSFLSFFEVITVLGCVPFPPLNPIGPDGDIKRGRRDCIKNCVTHLNHLMIISNPTISKLSFQ